MFVLTVLYAVFRWMIQGILKREVVGSSWLLILAGARPTILDKALSSAHTEFVFG